MSNRPTFGAVAAALLILAAFSPSLEAQCPSPPPVLNQVSPNGITTPGDVTVTWSAPTTAAVAVAYEVFVGFNDAAPTSRGMVATTSYTIQNVPPSTGVAMYVIAKTAVCPAGTQSGTLRFSACSAIKPLLSDPAEAASFTASPGGAAAVSFNWSGVPGATSYDVMVSSDGGASFLPSVTTSTTSGTANLLPGNYVTYIRAFLGPWCPPAESARRTFRVLPASCPTEKATPTAPAGGSTVAAGSPLTFTWTAVPSAVGYDLMISSDDGKTFVPRATVSATTAAPAASVTLGPGTYLWFVRTNFANCPPTASQVFRVIVVAATGCPASTPALLAPAGDSTVNNPVTFSWTAATGANRYRLMVSHDGGAFNAIALTDQTRYTATIPAGTIDWYVEALFDGCPSTQSQRSRFTVAPVAGCPSSPGKAAIVSPPNGATGLASPVTFRWNPVPGATEYRVLASFNGAALVSLGTTTGTSLTAPVAQATVFWFVETFFGKGCPSTLSERSLFTVAAGAACGTTAPTLVSPANGATDVRSPVTLQWNSVAGAVNYEVFVSLDGTSFDLLGQTSSTSLTRILPAGSVSWYVEAQFPGCPDLRSATSRFTISDAKSCPAGPITPNAPAAGSTVASPVTFSWSAIAGTPVYRVWLAHEGGAPALIARTTTTTATIPLPSGSAEWFVEAVTADCPSVYSPKVRFTIERGATCSGQAPSLLAPAAGASVTSPVELEWSAVPGAIAYRVWIASGAQPFSDLGIVTATKIKRELPAGAHQWYVEALFTGCPPVPSARGSFTVSTASRCGEAPALVSPADGATNVTNPVTLLWSNVTNAEGYRIFGSLDGTRFTLIGETRETTLTRAMPPGTITWYVEAVVRGCPSARSPNSRFTIARASDCNGEAPQLVSPANGATNIASPVDFVWNPVSGAVGYVVVVRLGDGSPIPVGQTAETHLLKTLPEGTFEWWVIAQFASCPGTESAHFTFSIPQTACDNRRPLLLTPPDGARDIAPAVFFSWTPVPRAKSYRLWASIDDDPPTLLATPSGSAEATVTLPSGSVRWMVEAVFDNCPATQSAIGKFTVGSSAACRTPDKPTASVAGQVLTNTTYGVRWTPLPGVTQYELQEATTADFSGATTQVVSGVAAAFTHSVSGTPMQYRYRVRGISTCSDERGPYSDVVAVTVMPLATATAPRQHASVEIGSQSGLTQRVFLPGSTSPVAFSVTADKPWMTVTPSSGTIPPEGLTLTVTFDPAALRPGTNSGSLSITYGASGKGATDATTVSKVPLSISLVTPVAPGGNNTPLPESLIIPAIAHAPGANDSLFESDVRVTNLGAETMKYQLHFTPSGTDGTQNGSSTTIEVAPGATMALDDILSSFFGST
ncbi:MAG TPA: hypothetical protein VNL91_00030, partial [Thermoanaerobaculia bacterium]|nr:hypothetical protein [Thermoanaerobaculia bacterium]